MQDVTKYYALGFILEHLNFPLMCEFIMIIIMCGLRTCYVIQNVKNYKSKIVLISRQLTGAFTPKSPTTRLQVTNGYHFRDTSDRMHRNRPEDSRSDGSKLRPIPSPRRHMLFPGSRMGW